MILDQNLSRPLEHCKHSKQCAYLARQSQHVHTFTLWKIFRISLELVGGWSGQAGVGCHSLLGACEENATCTSDGSCRISKHSFGSSFYYDRQVTTTNEMHWIDEAKQQKGTKLIHKETRHREAETIEHTPLT